MSQDPEIHFDFNYLMFDHLGEENGVTPERVAALEPALKKIHQGLRDLQRLGQLPFLDLPYHEEEARRLLQEGRKVREKFDDVVVFGIGGSALGLSCLEQALMPFYYKYFSKKERKGPRLWVCDNVDPTEWQALRNLIHPKKTFFIVISKSGGTTETMAAYLYFLKQLKNAVGPKYNKQIAFITDPFKGVLRQLAQEEGIATYKIHPGVGGRYSVLTPVGLFPAACMGMDILSLLAGARRMEEKCRHPDVWMNPALLSAALHYLYFREKGRPIRVVMSYSESLSLYPAWFFQLWAESLGKRHDLSGKEICIGSTPLEAVGAVDQHSRLQLFLEGPPDKVVDFIGVMKHPKDLTIPSLYATPPELVFPRRQTAGDLLTIEREATERALRRKGRPSMLLLLPRVSPHALGQLFLWAELESVMTGELYNINPFDQPGEELIKKYIHGALGKKGFEEYRKEMEGGDKKKEYIL